MKKLEKMSMEEIIREIGFFNLNLEDISQIMQPEFQEGSEVILDISKMMEKCENLAEKIIELKKYMCEHEEIFDKEKVVLMILYNINNALKIPGAINVVNRDPSMNHLNEQINTRIQDKGKKTCERILKENSSRKTICLPNIKEGKVRNIEVINFKELTQPNRKNRNQEKLKRIEEKMNLKLVIENITSSDVRDYLFNVEELGDMVLSSVAFNTIIENSDNMVLRDVINIEQEELEEMINVTYRDQYVDNLSRAFSKYSKYINFDKLLLLMGYNLFERLQYETLDPEKSEAYYYVLSKVLEEIQDKNTRIIDKESNKEKISVKTFQDEMKMFKKEGYIGKKERNQIRQEILQGDKCLSNYTLLQLESIDFSEEEIKIIFNKTENIRYFIEHDFVNKEIIYDIIETNNEFPSDIIVGLYSKGILSNIKIKEMFKEGKLNIQNIKELQKAFSENMKDFITDEELIKYYLQYKENPEDEEKFNMLNRMSLLYKELRLKQLDSEELQENGNYLIELLNTDFEENDLKELYKLGIIPVQTAIEWGGEAITEDMLLEKALKPADTKKMISENQIKIDYIINLLKSNKMSEEEKLTLIFSTFSEDNQKELRMKLMQYLNFKEESNRPKKDYTSSVETMQERNTNTEKRKMYVTDSGARWKLITLLDENYTQEIYNDGHIIFTLPNVDNGVVVIEKMFKKTKSGVKSSYGNATYIMSEEEFIKNKKQIADKNSKNEKTIDRNILLKLREEEKASKIVHSKGWGRNIKKYFGIEEKSVYTENQVNEIDKAIESIERSRTLE